MSKKVVRKAKLSFDLDEEDEENDDSFQVKKSKESKKFKKMRQAPGILDTEIIEDSGTLKFASAEIGGSYSAESLNQLKKAQLFIKQECPQDSAPPDTSMIEGVELSGEAAEEFVELTERLAMEKNANLGEYVSFGGGSADVDAIHAARLVNKTLLKGSTEKNDRIYTSTISKTDKRVAFDLTQDNDSDWEQEIIRRGVINTTALSKKNAQVTEKLLQRQSQGVMNSTANSTASISSTIGEITVADIVKSVQLAADKLEHNGASAKRKTEQIEVDISLAEAEEAKLRSNVEVGVKKLNIVQVCILFSSGLINCVTYLCVVFF